MITEFDQQSTEPKVNLMKVENTSLQYKNKNNWKIKNNESDKYLIIVSKVWYFQCICHCFDHRTCVTTDRHHAIFSEGSVLNNNGGICFRAREIKHSSNNGFQTSFKAV